MSRDVGGVQLRMRGPGDRRKRQLALVLILSGIYLVAEAVAGLLTGSLALLADAGHMFTDVAGLGLSLLSIWIAERPATPEKTYGYYRVEILAALINALALIGVSIYILYEAYQRFRQPPEVASGPMLFVAALGLGVNLVGLRILRPGADESLNMKGAYLEVMADMVSSIGVIAAAAIMWRTGWYLADPLVSAGIGLFILPRTWKLLREATDVLLEGTPADINVASLRQAIGKAPGVIGVHDLHVWTLTSGVNALSVHVVLADGISNNDALQAIQQAVIGPFNIAHTTIQVEASGHAETEPCL